MRALLLLLLAAPPAARAQDDAFRVDSVLVASLDPADPALRADATALRDLLHATLSRERVTVPMADVAPFRGYSADIYLQACPPGQYVDCAFVIGQRAATDWVIAGELKAVEGGLQVLVSFVDVRSASLLLQVPVQFEGPDDDDAAVAVARLLVGLLDGSLQAVDVRQLEGATPTEAAVDPAALQAAADELALLEEEEGTVDRGDRRQGRRARIPRSALDDYEGGELIPPWEGLALTPEQWRRWQNSGRTLADWRYRVRGRQGELLIGLSLVGVGWGPWTQIYEAWYAIDDFDLELSEQFVMQDLAPGLLRSWEGSLGVGVLPWLDVGVFGGPRVAPYRWRVQRLVENDDNPRLLEPQEQVVTTWHVGGRVTFAPMPTFTVRPTVGLGVVAWWGRSQARTVAVPDGLESLDATRMVLLQASPGVEVSVTRHLNLWARADVEVPVARRVDGPVIFGGAALPGRPSPDADDEGVSVGGAIGATVMVRVRPKRR